MLTHVKNKQSYHSVQDDPWTKGAIDGTKNWAISNSSIVSPKYEKVVQHKKVI